MFRNDESHQRDRGSGRHQKDPQAPGIMAGQASAPAKATGQTKIAEYSIDYGFT